VVSVPAGWLQIQNIHTRHLLSQTYPSWPLLAIPATATASAFSKHHESWATQWAFAHASAFGDQKAGIKTFVIKNRLTGAYMRHERSRILYRRGPDGSVNVWTATCYVVEEELWNLELDAESNWKIVHNCGFLLEQAGVSLLNGFEIVCATTTHDKRKSWAFLYVMALYHEMSDANDCYSPLNKSVQSFAGLVSDSGPNRGVSNC
jgi:hypothetical protein